MTDWGKEERLLDMQHILQAYANFDPEVGYTQGMIKTMDEWYHG